MGTFLVAAALAGAGLAAGFFASSSELESDKQKLINTKSQIKKTHTKTGNNQVVPELSELDESFFAAGLGVTVLTGAALTEEGAVSAFGGGTALNCPEKQN